MCTRYTLIINDGFAGRFGLPGVPFGITSRYNIAPGQANTVIVAGTGREAALMNWGLLPDRAGNGTPARYTVNARAETIDAKPMFLRLLPEQRCLVPASGFYEWKKEGSRKVPCYFHVRGGPVFTFAGLFDVRRGPQGQERRAYAIITTGANDLVAPVHDRMPVILTGENERRWLTKGPLPAAELGSILAPFPAGLMESYVVGSRVNDPRAEGESLIRPLTALT